MVERTGFQSYPIDWLTRANPEAVNAESDPLEINRQRQVFLWEDNQQSANSLLTAASSGYMHEAGLKFNPSS